MRVKSAETKKEGKIHFRPIKNQYNLKMLKAFPRLLKSLIYIYEGENSPLPNPDERVWGRIFSETHFSLRIISLSLKSHQFPPKHFPWPSLGKFESTAIMPPTRPSLTFLLTLLEIKNGGSRNTLYVLETDQQPNAECGYCTTE